MRVRIFLESSSASNNRHSFSTDKKARIGQAYELVFPRAVHCLPKEDVMRTPPSKEVL